MPKFSRAAQKIWVAQNLGGLQLPSPPRPVRLWLDRECGAWWLNLKYCDAPLRSIMWAGLIYTVPAFNMCWLVGSDRKSSRTFTYKMVCLIGNDHFQCNSSDICVGLLGCSGWSLLKFKMLTALQGTYLFNNIFYLFIYFYFNWTATFAKKDMALHKAQLKF